MTSYPPSDRSKGYGDVMDQLKAPTLVFYGAFGVASILAIVFLSLWTFEIWHSANALDQIEAFGAAVEQSEREDLPGLAAQLQFVLYYYPTGTKHATGSRIDRIVEYSRASSAARIIDIMRRKSKVDLGPDPVAWIARFAKDPP